MILKLFVEFFKVSCFAFGGAYGAIPLVRDMVLSNGWLSEDSLSYMIAVSESTPGPIMVNMATYIGSNQAGFWGALAATTAVVLPAYLIILLVMGVLKNVIHHPKVQAVLKGMTPCVIGIILATGMYMTVTNCVTFSGGIAVDVTGIIITALLLIAMPLYQRIAKKKLSPILLIILSACLGMILY